MILSHMSELYEDWHQIVTELLCGQLSYVIVNGLSQSASLALWQLSLPLSCASGSHYRCQNCFLMVQKECILCKVPCLPLINNKLTHLSEFKIKM